MVRTVQLARGVLVAMAVALALPSFSLAAGSVNPLSSLSGSSPLTPGLPQSQATTPTTTTSPVIVNPTTTSGDSSFSGSSAVVIAIGALVLIAGISFFIWRDARRRAPVRHRAAAATAGPGGRGTGSKQKTKPRKLSPAERKRRKRGRAR